MITTSYLFYFNFHFLKLSGTDVRLIVRRYKVKHTTLKEYKNQKLYSL
jgi:hypothetical protein